MIYVCSDLHGYSLEKFKEFLNSVGFCREDFLYVLGDVIDRGDDGIRLLKWMMMQPNVELILGNHEAMMLSCDFLFEEITDESIERLTGEKLQTYLNWIANGGQATLNTLSSVRNNETEYILEYLREAPLYETVSVDDRDFLLVHSGLGSFDETKKISAYTPTELLWARPEKEQRYFEDIFTVFGHTPTVYYGEEHKGKAFKTETWIDIDAGAAIGMNPMLLRLDDMKEFYID